MRVDLQKGRYRARHATSAADLHACQALRHQCFFGSAGSDSDVFDGFWQHLMVEDCAEDALVCTLRYCASSGRESLSGYAATFYDLAPFARIDGPLIEIGRFCSDPGSLDPHILRVAWGAMTQIVDRLEAQLIFGCTSFAGNDPAVHAATFQRLSAAHLGPASLRPAVKDAKAVKLAHLKTTSAPQRPMPPLMRTYLAMGGWVSDHAVIDTQMQTLHVLTALEISAVPPSRAKALRALTSTAAQ